MDHEPQIPWTRLAAFVRQHTHDVRNHLNSLDLEAALLSEFVPEGEAKSSLDRLRRQVREFAQEMRVLAGKFADPPSGKVAVPASVLVLIWQDQLASLEAKPEVAWSQNVGDARIMADPDAIARTFRELLVNAVSFGTGRPLRADAAAKEDRVAFTLSEPKDEAIDPSQWGYAPLKSTRRGGYGLGLWTVKRSVEASSGTVQRRYDADRKQLITTLSFPVQ